MISGWKFLSKVLSEGYEMTFEAYNDKILCILDRQDSTSRVVTQDKKWYTALYDGIGVWRKLKNGK